MFRIFEIRNISQGNIKSRKASFEQRKIILIIRFQREISLRRAIRDSAIVPKTMTVRSNIPR